MRFPFVQLEFSHAIGPEPGRYVVAGGTSDAVGQGSGPPVGHGSEPQSRDLLIVAVEQAPIPRRLLRRRRPRPVSSSPPSPVAVLLATHVRAGRPLDDAAQGDALLSAWNDDGRELDAVVARALAVVNRAIRAHRAATADPYAVEVTRADARAVRIGHGSAQELHDGGWSAAFELPAPRATRARHADLRPMETVAAVLGGRIAILDGEELVLRAVLDLEQRRPAAAAAQLRAALEVLRGELPDGTLRPDLAPAGSDPEALGAAAHELLDVIATRRAAALREGADPPD